MSADFASSIEVNFFSEVPAYKRKRTVSSNNLTALYLYYIENPGEIG